MFASYKVSHPLEHKLVIRIQTTAEYSPYKAFMNAIRDLLAEFSLFEERFKNAIKENNVAINSTKIIFNLSSLH